MTRRARRRTRSTDETLTAVSGHRTSGVRPGAGGPGAHPGANAGAPPHRRSAARRPASDSGASPGRRRSHDAARRRVAARRPGGARTWRPPLGAPYTRPVSPLLLGFVILLYYQISAFERRPHRRPIHLGPSRAGPSRCPGGGPGDPRVGTDRVLLRHLDGPRTGPGPSWQRPDARPAIAVLRRPPLRHTPARRRGARRPLRRPAPSRRRRLPECIGGPGRWRSGGQRGRGGQQCSSVRTHEKVVPVGHLLDRPDRARRLRRTIRFCVRLVRQPSTPPTPDESVVVREAMRPSPVLARRPLRPPPAQMTYGSRPTSDYGARWLQSGSVHPQTGGSVRW